MVKDLDMDVSIEIQSTVREVDGLALSSRNTYLSKNERCAAPILYKSLCLARDMFAALNHPNESIDAERLEDAVRSKLSEEPLVSTVQYVAIDNKHTMQPLSSVTKADGAIVSLACKIGDVRLIDNIILQ